MKYLFAVALSVSSIFFSFASCGKNSAVVANTSQGQNKESRNGDSNNNDEKNGKMKITIGSTVFTATLYGNEAAKAFKALLPLTIEMSDYNGNEKKYDFSKSFPTDNYNPKQINNGDLMIWSGNTLVMFYKSFPTSYSYTRLGRIDNASGIEKAVGTGNVTVKFELE